MRPRRSRNAGPTPIRWQAWALAGLVVVAILFGGGGAEGPLNNGVIQALSAILVALLFASHVQGSWPMSSAARGTTWLLLALLLIVALQLVPLPPSLWRSLPGRDLAESSLALLGSTAGWRPLSLAPEATRLFAASLLLPAAILYGLLGATRREALLAVRAVVIAAGASALIGAFQLTLGSPSWLTYYDGPNPGAASGVFANANHHALVLVGAILCLAFLIRADGSRAPGSGRAFIAGGFHLGWLAIPFFVVMTLATGSRAGMALLAIAVPGALLIALGRRAPILWFGGVAAVCLIVAMTILFSPSGNAVAAGQSFIFSEDSRYSFLPDVLYTFRQYWPWGSGLGTFVPVFAPNENLDVAGGAYVNHAHNDLFEWLLETGWIGALWLLVAVAILVWRMVVVARNRNQMRGTQFAAAFAGGCILLVIALHSLFDFPLRTESISALAAVAAGMMFSPLTDAPPRPLSANRGHLLLIVGGLAGVALAALVLRIFMAEAAVRDERASLALSLRPQNGRALALAAEEQLKAGRPESARRLATAAIERAPLTSSAVRVLAMAAPSAPSAIAAWRVASAMGWRDGPTQLWALQQALANGEFTVAAVRADAFLRTRSQVPEEYLALIRMAAAEPRFRSALIERLKLNPPWRSKLFELSAEASNEEIRGVRELLLEQSASGDPPALGEANSTIMRLIEHGDYAAAIALDRRVRGDESERTELLPDGGFDRSADAYLNDSTPLDWQIMPTRTTVTIEERNGRFLFIAADGSASRTVMRRHVPLDPGTYRLDYSRGGDAESPEAIGVSVRCAGGEVLASSPTEPLEGSGFERRQISFAVGPNCPLIIIGFDARAVGRPAAAEFDGFLLRRLP